MHEWIVQNELVIGLFFVIMVVGVLPILVMWCGKTLIDDIYGPNRDKKVKVKEENNENTSGI